MPITIADAAVAIGADFSDGQFKRDVNAGISKELGDAGKTGSVALGKELDEGASRTGLSMGGRLKAALSPSNLFAGIGMGLGMSLANMGTQAISGFIGGSITAASDLNETMSKVGVVFQTDAERVKAWGKNAAEALGMSQNTALAAAGTFGNLFVSMGMASGQSADMSMNLVGLSGDLASFNNMDPTQVLEALRSGLTGETEPLKRLGVNINEAMVKAKALEMGLWDGTGALSASAKAQATYALVLDQTKTAQGDFARTSDGLANQQRIFAAKVEDAQAKIGATFMQVGQVVLPVLAGAFTGLVDVFSGFINIAAGVVGALQPFAPVIGVIAAGILAGLIPTLITMAGAFLASIPPALAAGVAWLAAMAPVLIAAAPFIALGAIIAALFFAFQNNFLGIQDIVSSVFGILGQVFDVAMGVVRLWWEGVQKYVGFVAAVFTGLVGIVQGVVSNVGNILGGIVGFVTGLPGKIADAAKGLFDGIWQAMRSALNFLARAWNSLKFTLPELDLGPLGKVGGWTIGVPAIGPFHQGGMVPGAPGQDVLVLAQAGELITPAAQVGAMGNVTNVFNFPHYVGSRSDLTAAITAELRIRKAVG